MGGRQGAVKGRELDGCPDGCPRLPDEAGEAGGGGPESRPARVAHRFVAANGLRFHCVVAGNGPPVLLLHGFPEFWYG